MFKPNTPKAAKDILLLVFCVLGVAAVAWWAWAAGPVEPNSALSSSPQADTAQGLTSPAYGQAGTIPPADGSSAGSGSAGQAVSSPPLSPSGNTSSSATPPVTVSPEPDPLYPIDPTPKCPYYKYPGNIQPMIYCPVCDNYQSPGGIRYPCGCGGSQIDCVSPL